MINTALPINSHIFSGAAAQSVNARDLYLYLGVAQDFSNWIKYQLDGLFKRGIDFEVFAKHGENLGGRPRTEYALTLECAKHIAMMSRTARGGEARAYFIECERRALVNIAIPTSLSAALRLAADQAEIIEVQAARIEAAKPSVEFVDRYVDASGSKGFRQVCKLLGANENSFRCFLIEKDIWYRLGDGFAPYSKHIAAGRFEVKAGTAGSHAYNQTRFTPKGIKWIAGEWLAYIEAVPA